MAEMNDQLTALVAKLENAYQDRLVSVIQYGSASVDGAHDGFDELNVLCVLKHVTPRELADGEPVVRWWRSLGHISPLLMSEEEAHNSADSFPVEFKDMQERRKVLHGVDVIADLYVDPKYYRVHLEHELRAKQLRLRQQAAGILSDDAALMKLCIESVSTFCLLSRHALAAAHMEKSNRGDEGITGRRAVVERLGVAMRADMSPFNTLLDIREGKAGAGLRNVAELFAGYLDCVRRLVEFVDGLEEKS